METEKKKQSTILVYPSPGRSYLSQVVELSKLILAHHPDSLSITVITSGHPSDSPSLHSYASQVSSEYSINFIHLEAPLPGDGNHSTASSRRDPSQATREYVATLFEIPKFTNPALHDVILTLSHTYNIRAFLVDYFSHFASRVSSSLNLPTYYFTTMGAFYAAIHLYLPAVDPNLPMHFPVVPPIPYKDMPAVFTDTTHRVFSYLVDASTQLAKSNGFIVNTFEALEQRTLETILEGKCTPGEAKAPPIFCLGPLITPSQDTGNTVGGQDRECIAWLDSQPSGSVLFLCFGRFGTFSSCQLKEMAIGLERSGLRFLWVVRNPPEIATDEVEPEMLLPQGFLERTKERGLIVKNWAPQFQVLNHSSVGGFVTHCGWSSVMEAVQAGVPMLGWPLYAEQRMNRVYMVEEIKMAIGLREEEDGRVSAGELEQKVTELMRSEKGKEMRKRAAHMKQALLEALSVRGSSRVALAKLMHSFKL